MPPRSAHASPWKLALQGGGAHGAFTWGVLDRLLQMPTLNISAISGTSSGAMNAAALAQGWERGGAQGARASLAEFWEAVARHNALADWWAVGARAFDTAWFRPAVAPLAFNAMRPLIESFFDNERLRRSPVALHIAATRLRDGGLKVFDRGELSHDALLASACLPQWFPPVEIGGEAYWDGGYAGNPVLEPLLGEVGDRLLCVLVQPLERSAIPRQPREITEVSAQLAFGTAFRRELRDLAQARLRGEGRVLFSSRERALRRLRLSMLAPADALTEQGHAATDTRMPQLKALHDLGYAAADIWCHRDGATHDAGSDWYRSFVS